MASQGFVSIDLLDKQIDIQKKMYKAMASELNKSITKNKRKVASLFKNSVENWIRQSSEMISLSSSGPDTLGAQFGLPRGTNDSVVNDIVDSISDSLVIDFVKINRQLKGGVSFSFQTKDFANLLALPSATVITQAGQRLEWLNWLLNLGDTTIVVGFEYTPSSMGRSGGGTMTGGGLWRVPPNFSGTQDDNFITRSFFGKESEIVRILQGLFA